jgi:hypothetical protein
MSNMKRQIQSGFGGKKGGEIITGEVEQKDNIL